MLRPISVFVILALIPSTALGTTYLIQPDGSGDFPTIQAAIDAADPGNVIELADGTYTGDGNRDIDYLGKAISVRSQSGDPEFCIIDCEGSQADMHRGFIFQSQEDTNSVLQAITVTGGWRDDYPEFTGGGGINCEGASPKIDNCVFIANHADRGGAIRAKYESSPLILNCTFLQNSAGYAGGGVLASQSPAIKILNCTFLDNYAQLGGGVYLHGHEVEVDVLVDRCVFIGNETWDGGGALYRRSSWNELEVTNCVFSSNSAEDGGAFASYDSELTRFINCTFFGNVASTSKSYGDKGAAVCCYNTSTAYLENCIVAFSLAGEAVFSEPVNGVIIECCDFYGNVDGPGDVANQIGQNGNFSADPLFCDPEAEDFHLPWDSPCAPDNNPDCGLIGALDVGCNPTGPAIIVVDVPDDQGGWIIVSWPAFEQEPGIVDYTVQRLEEDVWITLLEIPAQQLPSYSVEVETDDIYVAGEPEPISYYRVLGYTAIPEESYESLPVSGYSIDNIAPPVPEVTLWDGIDFRVLLWENPVVEDFAEVCVYRGPGPGFEPEESTICTTEEIYNEDELNYYCYVVAAFDIHGNAGGYSNEVCSNYPTGVADVPRQLTLEQNHPNPFNPRTTISYELPGAEYVELRIYDSRGRLVRNLLGQIQEAGRHSVIWDGADNLGRAVASGTYVYRLEAGEHVESKRMVLIR